MITPISFNNRQIYQSFTSKKSETQKAVYKRPNYTPQRIGAWVLAMFASTILEYSEEQTPHATNIGSTCIAEETTILPKYKVTTTIEHEPETTTKLAPETTTKLTAETTTETTTTKPQTTEHPQVKHISEKLAQAIDKKLGNGFSAKVESVAKNINCSPNDLLAMMYSESGIDPSLHSENGAIGLIQFMPNTMDELGVKSYKLERMSGIKQMDYVEKFFIQNKKAFIGSRETKMDGATLYALCFLPAYATDDILCEVGSDYYSENEGLDLNQDGAISKSDLEKRINNKYNEMCEEFL